MSIHGRKYVFDQMVFLYMNCLGVMSSPLFIYTFCVKHVVGVSYFAKALLCKIFVFVSYCSFFQIWT